MLNIYLRGGNYGRFWKPIRCKRTEKNDKGRTHTGCKAQYCRRTGGNLRLNAHVQATDDIVAKKIIADIRDEEKAHVGELFTLLKYLDPKEAQFFSEGEDEVREMLEELNINIGPAPSTGTNTSSTTVGSLLKE